MGMPDHRANCAASEARLDAGGAARRSDQEPYSPSGSNPFGRRGGLSSFATLHFGHGIPAPPQLQACGPKAG
jgi:hypothetical protein